MSEIKTLNLTSLVSKKTRRARERFLQNFGKADRTTDELFEVYLINFNRQQTTALNLQRHVKQYVQHLKELHETSKALSQCLFDIHERDWPKHDIYENNAYELDHINEDLEEKLKESVLVPLEQYLGQFSEVREKIAKRGRKLVDYDSQRHSFEALQQQQQGKQQDETKLSKARDQLEEARKVYESLNNELHEELPSLFDNRLPFLITVFQRLFSSKITYHNDNASVYKGYMESVEQLAKAIEKGEFCSSSTLAYQPTSTSNRGNSLTNNNNNNNIKSTTKLQSTTSVTNPTSISKSQNDKAKLTNNKSITGTANTTTTTANAINTNNNNTNSNGAKNTNDKFYPCSEEPPGPGIVVQGIPEKPPVYLHRVRATYRYTAEDEDELSFEAGETIQVIEYDDPTEQEEGWQMGIKESDGKKGLFPANFTKEIE